MRDHRKAKAPSRRDLLKSATALAGAGAATEAIRGLSPGSAHAQGADPELARVQGARRILLKGGMVLTLDRQVGDFARADVLIEDGKIQEVRPEHRSPRTAAAVVDATNRIVMPGFIDTHHHFYQGILRNILSQRRCSPRTTYHDIRRRPDRGLSACRRLCRRADHRARHDRHGHHHRRRYLAGVPHARAQRRRHCARCRNPACASSMPIRAAPARRAQYPAGYRPAAANLLQLAGPAAHARAWRRSRRRSTSPTRARSACAPSRTASTTPPRRALLELGRSRACLRLATNTSTAPISTTRRGG